MVFCFFHYVSWMLFSLIITAFTEASLSTSKEHEFFNYEGEVSYDNHTHTISTFMLSYTMTKIRCAWHCLNDLQCNAIELCSTPYGEECRVSREWRDTGGIPEPTCSRFQMDDECEGSGYVDRKTGVCIYEECNDCDCVSTHTQKSGIYGVVLAGEQKHVYCSFETLYSWTVLQRRLDGSEDFYRNWTDYEVGFGNLESEFWLGNKFIHKLTADGHTILRIELEDHDGNTRYAEYNSLTVEDASDNYRIHVTGYSGNAGDSFAGTCSICNNGMPFSTYDRDNDNHLTLNCAVWGKGGWWHNACHNRI